MQRNGGVASVVAAGATWRRWQTHCRARPHGAGQARRAWPCAAVRSEPTCCPGSAASCCRAVNASSSAAAASARHAGSPSSLPATPPASSSSSSGPPSAASNATCASTEPCRLFALRDVWACRGAGWEAQRGAGPAQTATLAQANVRRAHPRAPAACAAPSSPPRCPPLAHLSSCSRSRSAARLTARRSRRAPAGARAPVTSSSSTPASTAASGGRPASAVAPLARSHGSADAASARASWAYWSWEGGRGRGTEGGARGCWRWCLGWFRVPSGSLTGHGTFWSRGGYGWPGAFSRRARREG